MSTLRRKGHCFTEKLQVARKDYICHWCGAEINAGEPYVVATEFPGGDAGYADYAGHPVRMRLHASAPCTYPPEEKA